MPPPATSEHRSGRNSITSARPITAVSPIALATSFFSARITSATATIAELPHIELPTATSTASFVSSPSDRPTAKLTANRLMEKYGPPDQA